MPVLPRFRFRLLGLFLAVVSAAVVYQGQGKTWGWLGVAFVFPWSALVIDNRLLAAPTALVVPTLVEFAVALLQFPLYGLTLDKSPSANSMNRRAALLAIAHFLAAVVALALR